MKDNEKKYTHGEAFALMKYASDDGKVVETIWNSRDGVTPFCVMARDGKTQLRHVKWNEDECRPDHKLKLGDRYFGPITRKKAEEYAAERMAQTDGTEYELRGKEREEMEARLVEAMMEDETPDLLTHEGVITRGVKCSVCGKEMFYFGDQRYEPELLVTVELPKWQDPVTVKNLDSVFGIDKSYVHVRCWNSFGSMGKEAQPQESGWCDRDKADRGMDAVFILHRGEILEKVRPEFVYFKVHDGALEVMFLKRLVRVANEIRDQVAEATAIDDPSDIWAMDPVSKFGMDSLDLAELQNWMECEYGLATDDSWVVKSDHSVIDLACLVVREKASDWFSDGLGLSNNSQE